VGRSPGATRKAAEPRLPSITGPSSRKESRLFFVSMRARVAWAWQLAVEWEIEDILCELFGPRVPWAWQLELALVEKSGKFFVSLFARELRAYGSWLWGDEELAAWWNALFFLAGIMAPILRARAAAGVLLRSDGCVVDRTWMTWTCFSPRMVDIYCENLLNLEIGM
jgi:hypothetical protein